MTFEEFCGARLVALLRLATVLAGDPHLAEDVVQDVLIKAQTRWERIVSFDAPEAYLRKMIINELISTRRRLAARARRERWYASGSGIVDGQGIVNGPGTLNGHGCVDGPEEIVQRDELIAQIRALPPRQRVVIALRYYEDMPDAEIAALLGCRPGTVRSQASRALATLREQASPREQSTVSTPGCREDS